MERIDFLDHHSFKEKDIDLIKRRAEEMRASYIITTEKDVVKLPKHIYIENLYVLKIEFEFIENNTLKCFRGVK